MQKTSSKTQPETKELSDIDQFLKILDVGFHTISEAGRLLISMRVKDKCVYSKIIQREPRLTTHMLVTIEAIGAGRLHPMVALDSSEAGRRARALPYEVQESAILEPLKVVVKMHGEKPEVVERSFSDLSKSEAQKVFSEKGIRSVSEQAEYIKSLGTLDIGGSEGGNELWKALGRGTITLANHISKGFRDRGLEPPNIEEIKGNVYACRKNLQGKVVFEETKARPPTMQAIIMSEGTAVIYFIQPVAPK